jgi:hypothetical protein
MPCRPGPGDDGPEECELPSWRHQQEGPKIFSRSVADAMAKCMTAQRSKQGGIRLERKYRAIALVVGCPSGADRGKTSNDQS